MPKVSVIMPVYNAERFLQATLDSVLSQDFTDFELIAVDDGSLDASRELLHKAARGDARVRLFFQHNQYCGIARNTGLNNARGEYVVFVDADDLLLPGALGRMVARAEATRAEVVLCPFREFEKDPAKAVGAAGLDLRLLPDKEVFNREDLGKGLFWVANVAVWGKIFRRSFLEEKQLRFYPLPRAEDVPFFVLAMTQARRIAALAEPVLLYRRYLGSGSMEDTRDAYPLALLQAARYAREDLKALGLWERYQKPFLDRILGSVIYNLNGVKSL